MSAGESWFAARILMERTHLEERDVDTLFEDKIILLRADTEDAALSKAEALGRASEHAYENAEGKPVRWIFREVLDVKELFDDAIGEGTEVYYALLAGDDVAHLRRALNPERAPAHASPNGR